MVTDSLPQRKTQLDKEEREHLEDVISEMRERVENNVKFQLNQKGLGEEPDDRDELNENTRQLIGAIELEAPKNESWQKAFKQYITGVGYTIVNRIAALRCMEVRGFVDEEVTVFKENGLTPAAETLVHEEFLLEDEAILEAYHNICDDLAEEIEILFDRSSAYSLIDPDDDTFEELCGMLDSVDDKVWLADDVLGWVYEYYNVKLLDDLRRKGDREGLDPEDVPPANQFYTPHWVVRMLTDNSLGKLYLEHTGQMQEVIEVQENLSPAERKNRPVSPDESPDIADFCTYLVPSEEEGKPTDFNHPEELRVIDPACGSGHFLLYAFDVLERIWRAETDLDREEIPRKILQHNLYGVDLDMRACQLAAFNLYMKGRTHAEAVGASGFDMPETGIVCADASVAETDGVEAVFDEVAGDDEEVEDALRRILNAFEEVHGLGSLLDVRGTLSDLFEDDADIGGMQLTLDDDPRESYTLSQVLHSLREAVEEHREADSFLAQDLRSFVRLLDILAQDYHVALMNPPYGSRKRMPDQVTEYVEKTYQYTPEYYITFFEVCEKIVQESGRIGMLIPRSFMFKKSFKQFRQDFVGGHGLFDFLAEFGLGVLDNATVRTAATVVRSGTESSNVGSFLRLYDIEKGRKEKVFTDILCGSNTDNIKRKFNIPLKEFSKIPESPLNYSIPSEVRRLHDSRLKIDADVANIEGESISTVAQGLATGNNARFLRKHFESELEDFLPYAKGGSDAWIVPPATHTVNFSNGAREIRATGRARFQNSQFYEKEGISWTYIKETGRRFGYLPKGYVFDVAGSMVIPDRGHSPWRLMSVLNSDLYHCLFLSLTPERQWNQGDVGRIPWITDLEDEEALVEMSKVQYSIMASLRTSETTSPYYIGPKLLPEQSDSGYYYTHPALKNLDINESVGLQGPSPESPISEAARDANKEECRKIAELEELASKINNIIYTTLDISESTQQEVMSEIFLRTSESPKDREVPDPESVPEVPEDIDEQVKDLVHHFAMEAVREGSDGIIPVQSADNHANMLDHIVERFEEAYGEHAEDRLIEVDAILGPKSATEEAYPNLRTFIEERLFDYHVSQMENTPIIWKLTTERLLADSMGEGFGCFIDYHNIDGSLFDRLSNKYLESRKAELRERRSAANRRRSDDSLSASERAEAAEQYERCASGLDQISVFEDVVQELGTIEEREFEDEDRAMVEDLALKIAAFRTETRERVGMLANLHERRGDAWFQDTFSDKFWVTVDEWRDEWINALEELECACEEYSKPTDEPVEAHLADLFGYFNRRLKGSDHYSSTGILFMTYYFEREGADLLDDDGQPFEHLTESERLLASLAMGLNDTSIVDRSYLEAMVDEYDDAEEVDDLPPLAEFKALAEEIGDRCKAVDKLVPSDWSERALSEITTAGYQPNRKHGVEINITPLADAEVVPKTVDDKVL